MLRLGLRWWTRLAFPTPGPKLLEMTEEIHRKKNGKGSGKIQDEEEKRGDEKEEEKEKDEGITVLSLDQK